MQAEVTLQMLLIVCPLVLLAATVDAIGGGGGLISLPAYLLAGLPPALAGGSNKLSASMGTLIATFKFFKDGKILIKPGLCAVLGALPGAWIGAQLLQMVDEQIIQLFLLVAIPLVAVLMLVKRSTPTEIKPITTARLIGCFGLGLGCGLYDGFFGPGTGTFLIILFTWLGGMDMVTASGTAKPVNLASNIASLIARIMAGQVLFSLAIPAMCMSVMGGYIGAFLAVRKGAKLVRYVMIGVLVLLMVKLITDTIGG